MKEIVLSFCIAAVIVGVIAAFAYGLDKGLGLQEWRDKCKTANGLVVRSMSGHVCIKAERIDLK
jgi:hypothetical protein